MSDARPLPSFRDAREDYVEDHVMHDLARKLIGDVLGATRRVAELVDIGPDQSAELIGTATAVLLVALSAVMRRKFKITDAEAHTVMMRELPQIIENLQNDKTFLNDVNAFIGD